MGDNSNCQLGFPVAQAIRVSQPMMVSSISPKPGKAVSSVHCADYASFAVLSSHADEEADELYSWGSSMTAGIVSQKQAPKKVEFPDTASGQVFKIKMMSAGADHAALVTRHHEIFVWGDNSYGQLGLSDNQKRLTPVLNQQV